MEKKVMLLSILILAFSNLSFRWPVNNGRITSVFGESRGDHFHDGIDLISPEDRVYPVSSGKLVFFWNKMYFPLENYWGGGNYRILRHENGLYSVYMHLQDDEFFKKDINDSDTVGLIGNTGHSYGRHIHFSILNLKNRESVNPFTILPACEDTKSPQILGFYIKIDNKYIGIRDNATIRLTKHYPMLVDIRDSISGAEKLGIYKIRVNFNNKSIMNCDFQKIGCNENGLTVNNRLFNNLFDEKGYYKIDGLTYNEGFNTLVVSVADFKGNLTEKTLNIFINLDLK